MNYGKPHIPFNSPLQFSIAAGIRLSSQALPGAGGSGAHCQAKRSKKGDIGCE